MDDEVMAALIGVLETLWRIEAGQPGKPCSLAKLSKQSQRPMSVLRRQLLMLADADWIELRLDEGGITGSAQLSPAGLRLARELFP
ncbi:MAG TPA: ArsR family transcriptional regulator [Duganella sp.]|nr:ArsR family transcriptional regulator [Duganella sp.]